MGLGCPIIVTDVEAAISGRGEGSMTYMGGPREAFHGGVVAWKLARE